MSIGNFNCLAVVPARGGSKGIPLKNLSKIGARTLIHIVGDLIGQLDWIDQAIISSDHPEMIKEGRQNGLDVIFERPRELSNDSASGIEVCRHAWREAERHFSQEFDLVILLEPTCPFRTPEQVERIARKLLFGNYDQVIGISQTDSKSHPFKQFFHDDLGRFFFYEDRGKDITARQQLKPTFHRNGVAYAFSRDALKGTDDQLWMNWTGVIIDDLVVNIDTYFDLELARFLWSKNC